MMIFTYAKIKSRFILIVLKSWSVCIFKYLGIEYIPIVKLIYLSPASNFCFQTSCKLRVKLRVVFYETFVVE